MEETLRCTLGSQAQHAHSLDDHTWSIQQSTSTHTKHLHSIQQQNSNHTQTYCDMSTAFDTINIHTLIRKLRQTKIPGTIIKLIANYIKGRKAYTTYINHKSSCQFKTGVPQGGVLSPTLFKIYTADIPPPRAQVQIMAYVDDITITSTHTHTRI